MRPKRQMPRSISSRCQMALCMSVASTLGRPDTGDPSGNRRSLESRRSYPHAPKCRLMAPNPGVLGHGRSQLVRRVERIEECRQAQNPRPAVYSLKMIRMALRRAQMRLIIGSCCVVFLAIIGATFDATSAGAQPGYWLGADDGGVFSFNAPFYGSTVQGIGFFSNPGDSVCTQGCTITSQATSEGYWQLVTSALNPSNFSDSAPEGLVVQGFGASRAIDNLSEVPTSISSARPRRIAARVLEQASGLRMPTEPSTRPTERLATDRWRGVPLTVRS